MAVSIKNQITNNCDINLYGHFALLYDSAVLVFCQKNKKRIKSVELCINIRYNALYTKCFLKFLCDFILSE